MLVNEEQQYDDGEQKARYERAIAAFHLFWDRFPGAARLLTKKHYVLATNSAAEALGYRPGVSCATVRRSELHKGCRMIRTFKTKVAQVSVRAGSVQAWVPLEGCPDVLVHFILPIPDASAR